MRNLFILFMAFLMSCLAQAQSTETLYLSGTGADHTVMWDFFCSKGMNSGRWRKIAVPSCWETQGFGEYTYGRYYKKKDGRVSDETGSYRHTFNVPKEWNGKKVELVFEGVMTDATVTVNGQSAGDTHQGGFTSFSYDISSLINYGKKNKLEVLVEKQSKNRSVNAAERRADWWLFGGIYRPVYLRALPRKHIERVAVDAHADGRLDIDLYTVGLAHGYSLVATIDGIGSRTFKLSEAPQQRIVTTWSGIKPWDTEHPHLYMLNLTLVSPDGTKLHQVSERIGFRTLEFRRRDGFYLNGTKLTIKGVNRHCFYPETGRTTSKSQDITDVKLVKGMNANAIRSHYPPDRHLLDICDSLGVLYFNELPGWQNHYNTTTGAQILREMVTHDANHPCIFAWGNGNEGGFNLALDTLFAKYDPQRRHVVHPWARFDGVDAHHYPAYQTGAGRLGNGYEVFMPTEFLHSQYDKGGGASLDDFWANYSRNPLFAGGFIWAMIDEGVVRTDRNGEIDTDGGNAPDGVLGPHREKEGSWFTIRDVWAPLQIAPVAIRPTWDGRLTLKNEFLFSKLDEYILNYEVVGITTAEEKTIEQGKVALPAIGPGESSTVKLSLSDKVKREADVLRLTALSQQGDTINIWSFPMKYADEYYAFHGPKAKVRSFATVEGNTLSANGVVATFDALTGMLTKLSSGGRELPFNNGPLPVGMKMKLKSITSRRNGAEAQLVMHYRGAADSIVWTMTPDGLLGMDAVVLNDRKGRGYDGTFFDSEVRNLGFSFSYPEEGVKGMRWLGKGPYRVWRNRQRGTNYGLWQKDYNNTVTGESTTRLIYPEFKGYHANLYWAEMLSDTAPFTVYSETDGLYYRVFTPHEPKNLNDNQPTMQSFPDGNLSFLWEIPSIRSYKPIEQLGPQAQPSNIRINKGDDGLRMRLWFDFRN